MAENEIQPAISVWNVNKSFHIPLEKSGGIKQKLINQLKGRKGYRDFQALKDMSFTVKKGEFFGIVGRNGSGKSTLLKIMAGIYTPQKGNIQVNGALVPFIELGVGFNPELTGRENVFLNGALLGFGRREIEGMYDDIVDFAEIREFMEERLKNYSSGMQVRLAFSIAIRAKSDILLLDEVLAVGDEAFQRKCVDYFYRIKRSNQTVVLVTHDMTNVERFCDRALVLNNNKIMGIYKPAKAKMIYEQLNRDTKSGTDKFKLEKRWGNREAIISSIKINQQSGGNITVNQGDPFEISVKTESKDDKKIRVGLAFYENDGTVMSGPNSYGNEFMANELMRYKVKSLPLNPGDYNLRVALYAEDHLTEYDHIEEALKFRVVSDKQCYGKVNLFGVWDSSKSGDEK